MRFALIVATLGRDQPVGALLATLAAQTHRDFRVIIVDQNADGRLGPVVAPFLAQMDILHLVIPPRGVSQARNQGIAAMQGEDLVAFPDDDCFYDCATLALAAAAFSQYPEVATLMGSLQLPEAPKAVAEADPHPAVHDQISRTNLLRTGGTVVQFFRRRVVDAVGGFDERLGPGGGTPWLSGEDSDFLVRAAGHGPVARCPAVRVYHPAVTGFGPGYREKAFGYGRGRIRLLRKNGYPLWFIVANILHPLLTLPLASAADRRFRYHLFRGRLREFIAPHRLLAE